MWGFIIQDHSRWRKGRQQDWAEGEGELWHIACRALKLGEPCRGVLSWTEEAGGCVGFDHG